MRKTNQLKHLAIIAVLGFVRLAASTPVFHNPAPAYFPDSADYEPLGLGLLNATSYRWEAVNTRELFRPPGYPAFIALIYGALGVRPGNLAVAQLALGGVIALMLYDSLARLNAPRAGLLAAALYLADPFSAIWALPILSDTLFATLIVASLYGLIRYRLGGRIGWLALSGALGGLASIVRPIGVLLLPVWTVITLFDRGGGWLPGQTSGRPLSLRPATTLVLAFLGIVIPWSFRNLLLWDTFSVSSVAQYNLEHYLAPAAIAEREGVSLEQARSEIRPPAGLSGTALSFWNFGVIAENFGPYLKAHLRGVVHTAFGIEYVGWFTFLGQPADRIELLPAFRSGGLPEAIATLHRVIVDTPYLAAAYAISLGYQTLLYLGGLVGFRRLYARTRWTSLLLAVTGIILIVVPGPVGEARFRIPVHPLLAMLAGYAVRIDEA